MRRMIVILLFTASMASAWTVDSLTYTTRKKITTQFANVDAALTNYTLYVPIVADGDIGGGTNADGYDIRFTSSDGSTLLDYDRESHIVTAGDLTAHYWVKVPSISDSAGTDIYIYYRSDDTADGSDSANAYDANTVGVWHMAESAWDGTAGEVIESKNSYDGTAGGNATTSASGKIYRCGTFDGTNDLVTIADGAWMDTLSTHGTISAWVNATTFNHGGAGGYPHIVCRRGSADIWDLYWDSSGTAYFTSAGDIDITGTGSSTSTWELLCVRWTTNDGILYRNSGSIGTDASGSYVGTGSEALSFGDRNTTGRSHNGLIDNVVISDTARSAAWVKFQYYNENEADNELTWGSEETDGGGGAPPPQVIIIISKLLKDARAKWQKDLTGT